MDIFIFIIAVAGIAGLSNIALSYVFELGAD